MNEFHLFNLEESVVTYLPCDMSMASSTSYHIFSLFFPARSGDDCNRRREKVYREIGKQTHQLETFLTHSLLRGQ